MLARNSGVSHKSASDVAIAVRSAVEDVPGIVTTISAKISLITVPMQAHSSLDVAIVGSFSFQRTLNGLEPVPPSCDAVNLRKPVAAPASRLKYWLMAWTNPEKEYTLVLSVIDTNVPLRWCQGNHPRREKALAKSERAFAILPNESGLRSLGKSTNGGLYNTPRLNE